MKDSIIYLRSQLKKQLHGIEPAQYNKMSA